MRARVDSCTGSAGQGVQEIRLSVAPGFHFRAGQYLEIELPDAYSIALSIASAPYRLPELHLHYRSTAGLIEARLLDEQLTHPVAGERHISIRGPFGTACPQLPLVEPLLIVAGGTGGAQAIGLLDALLHSPPQQPVTLLWCADHREDLYRRRWLQSLNREWLTCECIVDARRDTTNQGMQWLAHNAPALGAHQIILSGSPGLVIAAADVLAASGIAPEAMRSDMFGLSPDQPPPTT